LVGCLCWQLGFGYGQVGDFKNFKTLWCCNRTRCGLPCYLISSSYLCCFLSFMCWLLRLVAARVRRFWDFPGGFGVWTRTWRLRTYARRFRGLGTTSLLLDSVMTYASCLHATPFFAPHDELNTLQLLHMLIMYVYIS
jgi:hypothetical protein